MGWFWEGLRRMFCTRPKQAQGDASKLHLSELPVQDSVTSSIEESKVHWSELPVQDSVTPSIEESKVHWSELPVQDSLTSSIEESKVHWSELPVEPTTSETLAELEIQEKNRISWEALQQMNPSFFQDWSEKVEIGQLIAEGGQAQIYEATWKMEAESIELLEMPKEMVVKVFKLEGCSLEDFSTQWPRVNSFSKTVLANQRRRYYASFYKPDYVCPIIGAFVLKEKRFAFLMQRYTCDLRTLIDSKMRDNGGHGPPLYSIEIWVLRCIAKGMRGLHEYGVLHRDLKASNVLVVLEDFEFVVSDYECSLSTIGTGFWRAPEVLQELRDGSGRKREDIWTTKSDVYSFGMLCFEVLTGGLPFVELRGKKDWDEIIDHGKRPLFHDYVDSKLQELVKRCWDRDPEKRPSFHDIVRELNTPSTEDEERDRIRKERLRVRLSSFQERLRVRLSSFQGAVQK